MKKILYSFIGLVVISFTSCDINNPNEDKFEVDPQSGWVEFAETGAVIQANANCGANQVLVPIELNAPVNDGLEVYYTITDVIGTSAGAITSHADVPQGSRNGNVVITYPETLSSSLEFTVTLTGTNRSNVIVAGTAVSTNLVEFPDTDVEQTVTVKINTGFRDRFLGVYDVIETGSDGATFAYESVVERGTADNELIITNLFDSDPNSQTRIFINPDGTVTFPAFLDNLLFVTGGGSPVFFEGLNGSVSTDPCDGEIELDFNLRVGPTGGTTVGPTNVVLTRQ